MCRALLLVAVGLAARASPSSDEVYYQHFPGYISDGGDLRLARQTITEAKAFCTALPGCLGFTFNSLVAVPAQAVEIRFKSQVRLRTTHNHV